LQAHAYQWLGSFGNSGNGEYREELRRTLGAIQRYLAAFQQSVLCSGWMGNMGLGRCSVI
jgi:hypothetical protein